MKKIFLITVAFILIVLVSCQSEQTDPNPNLGLAEFDSISNETLSSSRAEHIEPQEYIGVRSLSQLNKMSLMLQSSDQELNSYLLSIEGGGANSREDLEYFLELIASLPYFEIIDGEIAWIAYYADANIVYLSTIGSNGDWTRIEYYLDAVDVSNELERSESEEIFDISTISNVVQYEDGRLKVFSEVTEAHPSNTGETVEWLLTIDGIVARLVYYTADSSNVQASNVFECVSLSYMCTTQDGDISVAPFENIFQEYSETEDGEE